jgi:serine/threonine protein kinase
MEGFPQQIGPYVPERLLGRGAMAAVYLCRNADGEAVAVKWLDDAHQALMDRFDRECRSLADLHHPGIVGFRAHGTHLGRPFLAMEYVEGTELRVYIDKLHRRPPAERYARCRAIGIALCEALEHLHAHGLVHRDIKPTNVLMADDGRILLSDLGIVQRDGDAEPRHGTLVGTPAYAAPEQAFGGRVDPRADLFGLGGTLYHVLTQRRPFDGIERENELPPRPSRFDPGIPTDLEAVILRLLAPDPAHRYMSAALVREALAAGRDEGVQVAGRQDAVAAAADALRRAEAGEKVWVRPIGPRGGGRGWLARMVARSARRHSIPALTRPAERFWWRQTSAPPRPRALWK